MEEKIYEIPVYHINRNFQLQFKRSWDNTLYIECGEDWNQANFFGHPLPGIYRFKLNKNNLSQISNKANGIICHYPIIIDNCFVKELEMNRI